MQIEQIIQIWMMDDFKLVVRIIQIWMIYAN